MRIWQIKCKRQFAGPGVYAYVAEAKVVVEEPDELFVTVHDYDGFRNYMSKGWNAERIIIRTKDQLEERKRLCRC